VTVQQSGTAPMVAAPSLSDRLGCVGHTESIADARFGVHTSVNTGGRPPRRERLVGGGYRLLAGRCLRSATSRGACTPTCGNYVGATYTLRALLP
jgi:hypothetical protein